MLSPSTGSKQKQCVCQHSGVHTQDYATSQGEKKADHSTDDFEQT